MFNFKKWYIAMFGNVITLIKSPLVQKETNHFKKKKKKKKIATGERRKRGDRYSDRNREAMRFGERNRERGRVISGQYHRRTLTTKILASFNRQCTVTE